MFKLPDLPYEYNALEPYIDEETMRIHHDKHHGAYVEKLNAALTDFPEFLGMDIYDLLKKLDSVPEQARVAVRNNGGGHANHSFFWEIMGNPSNDTGAVMGAGPKGALLTLVNDTFGSFEALQAKFGEAAAARFGSGWAWLVVKGGALSIVSTANQDSPWMSESVSGVHESTPILGIDVWEHAYYLKYQNKRPDYVTAWWNVVNWDEVEKRFAEAKG